MSNAATKPIISLITALTLGGAATSCGTSQHEAASQMLARAEQEMAAGEYEQAMLTMDSIDSIYIEVIDVRRDAMPLKVRARESAILKQLSLTDSLFAVNQLESERLGATLSRVDNEIEPYFVAKEAPSARQGIVPRISPDGMFYIVSTLSSPRIGHTSVKVSDSTGASASTPSVARDGERNDVVGGAETIHFIGAEADTVGSFIAGHPDASLTLTFIAPGGKSHSQSLSPSQRQAVADAWLYSRTIREAKVLSLRRESLEQQLQVARAQSARLLPVREE